MFIANTPLIRNANENFNILAEIHQVAKGEIWRRRRHNNKIKWLLKKLIQV